MRKTDADANPDYWDDYTNFQHVKHSLIREYLKGWLPKLGLGCWAGRILYVDAHAGRGRHSTGQPGSPLVALETLLNHSSRDEILRRSEVRFIFVERDQANLSALKEQLSDLGQLPPQVKVQVQGGDCEELLPRIVDKLRAAGSRTAPAFVLVDPYTYRVQYSALRDLMRFERVELFVNIIWRQLDLALSQASDRPFMGETLDFIFGGDAWRARIAAPDQSTRLEQVLGLVRELVGVQWMTSVRMLGPNNAPKHVLAHLTNHEAGRDLMKNAMWGVCPMHDGLFYARQADNPAQGVLLALEPNLTPLKESVLAMLRSGPVRWQSLDAEVRRTLWLQKHLNSVVRDLRRQGSITAEGYSGRFSRKANPLLALNNAS